MKKNTLILLLLFFSSQIFSQDKIEIQERLFEQKIDTILEELKFNYEYDQALREYVIYKTFDKSITDSIENLESEKDRIKYILASNFKSDLEKSIWENFIHPADDKFTEKLIEITDSVGYPSLKRIKKYYKKKLPEEFNPTIFFVHANKKYWSKIKTVAEREFSNGNMGMCDFGYIMWHISGRKENSYLENNGIRFAANSEGRAIYIETCEDE